MASSKSQCHILYIFLIFGTLRVCSALILLCMYFSVCSLYKVCSFFFFLTIVSIFIFMGGFCFSGLLEWFELPSLCLYESLTVETTHFCCYNTYFILKDNSSGPDACFEYVAFHNVPIATGHVSQFPYNDFCLNFFYVMSLWYTFSPYFNSSDFLLYVSKYIKVLQIISDCNNCTRLLFFHNLKIFFFKVMSYFILHWLMTCTLYLKPGV